MSYQNPGEFPQIPMRPAGKSSASKTLTIALAVIGAVALIATVFATTVSWTIFGSRSGSSNGFMEVSVQDVMEVSIDSRASDFTVRFGDVENAQLSVEGERAENWKLENRENELVVTPPHRGFSLWVTSNGRATLTLPRELEESGVSLDFEMGAGSFFAEGSFTSVEAEVAAGTAKLLLSDVQRADLQIAAGSLNAQFTGTPPSDTELDVSAGTMTVILPNVPYAVTVDTSAGSLTNKLVSDPTSKNVIFGDVAAGSLNLIPAD